MDIDKYVNSMGPSGQHADKVGKTGVVANVRYIRGGIGVPDMVYVRFDGFWNSFIPAVGPFTWSDLEFIDD